MATDFITIILSLVGLASFFLAVAMSMHWREKRDVALLFIIIALDVSLWAFTIAWLRYIDSYALSFLVLRILYAIPIVIPLTFVYFAYAFINYKKGLLEVPWVQYSTLILTAVLVLATALGDSIIADVVLPAGREKIVIFGPWFALYASYFVAFFSWGLAVLCMAWLRESREQYRFLLLYLWLGTTVTLLLTLAANIVLPWWGVYEYNWFGNATALIFVGFLFYASVREATSNVRLIVTEILIFGLWTLLLFRVFISVNTTEQVLNLLFFIFALIFGTLIINFFRKERQGRLSMEELAYSLSKANEYLQILDKEKDEFVSIASHQLRAPLSSIVGYTSLMSEGSFGKVPKSLLMPLARVTESARLMAIEIEDFLNITRIEQGKLQYRFAPIDLVALVRQVADSFTYLARERNLTLLVDTPDAPLMLEGDHSKLHQALTNLIDNALRFTTKGYISVRLECKDREHVRLVVEDSGIGIPAEEQEMIFEKFTRASNAGRHTVHGTGLGLYLVREIVRAHRGDIAVESEEGEGSRFSITLPFAQETEERQATAQHPVEPGITSAGSS